MPTKAKPKAKADGASGVDAKTRTRLLLMLWDLGGAEAEVKKSELTEQVKQSKETAAAYQSIYDDLEKAGAIAVTTKNRSVKISLTDKGLQMLEAGLKSPDFQYGSRERVRVKDFNALLNWIKRLDGAVNAPVAPAKAKEGAINSYAEFKQVAINVYDQLNRDYNLDDLVPIYRIRREIGDRVSRSQFNEWLMEMQANDVFQLMGGEMPDITPDKAEDSITTELSGLRYYAKHLNS